MRDELRRTITSRRRLPTPAIRRAVREEAQVSQEALGRELEPPVHRSTISKWEAGARPSDEYIDQYVELLDELRSLVA